MTHDTASPHRVPNPSPEETGEVDLARIARRMLGVPALPEPLEDTHGFWMSIARQWAAQSPDPLLRSGACAVRSGRILMGAGDRMPSATLDSRARRTDKQLRPRILLSAPAALVAGAASHGVSLQSSTVYCWPLLDSALSVALLIQAGCREIYELDMAIPARLEQDRHAITLMASENGVRLHSIDPDAAHWRPHAQRP